MPMKLFSRLFLILLTIFVVGVVLLVVVPSASVMSRVATGLVTGSFVGIITALTNYFHLRQSYFEKLALFVTEVSHSLEHDYAHARARTMFISEMTKQQMIKYAAEHEKVEDKMMEADAMKERYESLVTKFDFEAYVPLIPFANKKLRDTLDSLESFVGFNVRHLYGEYQMCYDFTLLSADVTKEEQEIAIGDPDEFYELAVQNNMDYRDLLAYYLNKLKEYDRQLLQHARRYTPKMYRELMEGTAMLIEEYLKGVDIRDVIHERCEEIEAGGDA